MIRRCTVRGQQGFTLVELLVVIAIIIILLGIMVPVGMRLRAGSRSMECETNLRKIYNALKLYRLDEGGFPPYFWDATTGTIHGRGLITLVDMGYLRTRESLRCPGDKTVYGLPPLHDPGYGALAYDYDATDPLSYQWIDPDAPVSPTGVPAFRYLTDRGVGPADPDIDRIPSHDRGPLYQPDDTTVLVWCPFHKAQIKDGGRGQYVALFYDGRVERMDAELFTTGDMGTAPPESPWRVWPDQVGWSAGAPVY